MDRRTYLKSAGATLGSFVIASTGATAIEYDRTVNIVEAGADPDGNRPIDDVFADVARNGTLVEFPDGEYAVNGLSLYRLENFGMRATGDATLVPGPDAGTGDDSDYWIAGAETRNFRFEGFTLDTTADGASPTVAVSSFDGLVVRDIWKKGAQNDGSTAFSFRVTRPNGSGLVENLRAPAGDTTGNAVGMYVNTTGTLTVRNCRLEEFGNNGLYASDSDGPVQVEGGFYRNNDVTSIRLGSAGSYVRGADIVIENPSKDDGNYRGVRVADGPGPVTIRDIDIRAVSGQATGAVVCAYDGGSMILCNSRIHIEPEYTIVGTDEVTTHAVHVDEATGIDDPGERRIWNLSISGAGNDYPVVKFNRDNNTIESCQIQQGGTNRNGVHVASGSTNNAVLNTAIEVTGQQINNDGEVRVENLADDADPAPVSIDEP